MYKTLCSVVVGVVLAGSLGCAWISRQSSPSAGTGPVGATVTIENGAVTPKTVSIHPGQLVTFVNKDAKEHQMFSNPHPVHTDCRPMNAVGKLTPGQSRNTALFQDVKNCGFHDHGDHDNAALQGTISVAN
jgi:plastocyanin